MTLPSRLIRPLLLAMGTAVLLGACTPTIRLQVDPIQIYAKLDADVRVRLDQELRDLLTENPNLF
ncbi:YnbE family lipoprotein [Brevundimonas subvibrioides]|uniref:YnbE family lipoprotein n=1 Tax=Brevundimonas subvibrioides TaxID=74313 RepID=UPI0022B4FDD5|nr:YnbE family lipoprotein [Brevundimonas subvibrioides]